MKTPNAAAFPFFQKTVMNFRLLLQKGREAPHCLSLDKNGGNLHNKMSCLFSFRALKAESTRTEEK